MFPNLIPIPIEYVDGHIWHWGHYQDLCPAVRIQVVDDQLIRNQISHRIPRGQQLIILVKTSAVHCPGLPHGKAGCTLHVSHMRLGYTQPQPTGDDAAQDVLLRPERPAPDLALQAA